MLVRNHEIVDDRLCYEKVREPRWAEGVNARIVARWPIDDMVIITPPSTDIDYVISAKTVNAIMTTSQRPSLKAITNR